MRFFAISSAALLAGACGVQIDEGDADTEELIAKVPLIVGMTKDEIDAEWGEPNCPPKNSCEYGDRLSVYYVDGRAANITLPPVDDVAEYGFDVGTPSFENTGVTRWNVQIDGETAELSSFEDTFVYLRTVDSMITATSLEIEDEE